MIKKKLFLVAVLFTLIPNLYAQVVRLPQEAKQQKYHEYSLDDRGFWLAVEGSAASSVIMNHHNFQRATVSVACGYRLSEFLRFGVGLGGHCYINGNKSVRGNNNMFTMPVFFDMRGNIVSQDVREIVPYWSVDVGANLGDGFFVSPTLGMRIGEPRKAFLIGLSYTIGEIDTTIPHVFPSYIHQLGLKIGYEF